MYEKLYQLLFELAVGVLIVQEKIITIEDVKK